MGEQPQAAVTPAELVKDHAPETSAEPPVEIYEQKNGVPLIVDLMDLRSVYGNTQQEGELASIDAYLIAEINRKGLTSTKTSYASELQKLESQIDNDPNLDYPERIDKLATYVNMLKQQNYLKQMRRLVNGA